MTLCGEDDESGSQAALYATVRPRVSLMGERCMNCRHMPKFAKNGDLCVGYTALLIPAPGLGGIP